MAKAQLSKFFETHRVGFAWIGVLGSIAGFVISALDLDNAIKRKKVAPKKA